MSENRKELNKIESQIVELEDFAVELYLGNVGIRSVVERYLEPDQVEEYYTLKKKQGAILTEIVYEKLDDKTPKKRDDPSKSFTINYTQ